MSNFPTRSRAIATEHRRWSYEDHIHILPPTDLQPPAPLPKTPESVSAAELPTTTADRRAATPDRQHVKAWRVSGLSRADYCRRLALNPNTFNRWVECQRPSVRPNYRKVQGAPQRHGTGSRGAAVPASDQSGQHPRDLPDTLHLVQADPIAVAVVELGRWTLIHTRSEVGQD